MWDLMPSKWCNDAYYNINGHLFDPAFCTAVINVIISGHVKVSSSQVQLDVYDVKDLMLF